MFQNPCPRILFSSLKAGGEIEKIMKKLTSGVLGMSCYDNIVLGLSFDNNIVLGMSFDNNIVLGS